MLAYAGESTPASAAMAPFRALATPLADLLKPMPYPEMYPPEDPDYRPTAVARTLFIDRSTGRAETILEHLERPTRRCARRSCGCWAGRWRGCRRRDRVRAPRPRIMVNVAAFYDGEDDSRCTRRGSTSSPRRCSRATTARTSTSSDEGEDRVRGGLPGRDLGPAGRGQAPVRPGQPVPPQPEHPAGRFLRNAAAGRLRRSAPAGNRTAR